MLQKEKKMDHVMPVPVLNMSLPTTTYNPVNANGSLSDGSVCDLPPLNKIALKGTQFQNQPFFRRDLIIPPYKTNGIQRKRFKSVGDKDQTGSSGYDTSSKKSRNESSVSPAMKSYNPVMENRVSSTNNDVVYKFTGSNPAEDFEVTYTVEERVKAAAFAIVYNNCKISTDKFESLYDKPAPDFKTIFSWRQRLLTTGCLVDSHLEVQKKVLERPFNNQTTTAGNNNRKKVFQKLPNPDEIAIMSDSSEENCSKNPDVNNQVSFGLRQKSLSADTLIIGGIADSETRATGGSVSTVDEGMSQGRSHSASTHNRTRSSSCDSQDSNYPESDVEQMETKILNTKKNNSVKSDNTRQSVRDSDSESISYNSDEVDFRSRVFGDSKKFKCQAKKRPTTSNESNLYAATENQPFQGYSTLKLLEQSPLATGNIYSMSNFQNMSANQRNRDSHILENDGYSSEYVPTKLGVKVKNNYQDFKNNVKKRGFWAKGNGSTFSNVPAIPVAAPAIPVSAPAIPVAAPVIPVAAPATPVAAPAKPVAAPAIPVAAPAIPVAEPAEPKDVSVKKSLTNNYFTFTQYETQLPGLENRLEDFTKDEIDNSMTTDQYMPFDKPLEVEENEMKTIESSSRIFDIVQSNFAVKNRSIMDIFGNNDDSQESSNKNNDLDNFDSVKKIYEPEWDEDDDALYKNSDSIDILPENSRDVRKRTPSPPNIGALRAQSPVTNSLYGTGLDTQKDTETTSIDINVITEKRDMLLGLLKDLQGNEQTNNDMSCSSTPTIPKNRHLNENLNQTTTTNFVMPQSEAIPKDICDQINFIAESNEDIPLPSSVPEIKSKVVSPSKRVHVLESITIKPDNRQNIPSVVDKPDKTEFDKDQPFIGQATKQTAEIVSPQNIVNQDVNKTQTTSNPLQLDLSNILSNINTNTLLLALQNLQQFSQQPSNPVPNDKSGNGHDNGNNNDNETLETINLTNDEEWEKESNQDESIERQLEKLDGNTGDTPFLSDIFDPGPVVIPPSVTKKLNINLKNTSDNKTNQTPHLNENAPVIGNFKSFALPKPIMLNRLKLTVKQPDKNVKTGDGKRIKQKRKVCITYN